MSCDVGGQARSRPPAGSPARSARRALCLGTPLLSESGEAALLGLAQALAMQEHRQLVIGKGVHVSASRDVGLVGLAGPSTAR